MEEDLVSKLSELRGVLDNLPVGYVILPIQPTKSMLKLAAEEYGDLDISVGELEERLVFAHQAMVEGFMRQLGCESV